MPRYYVSVRYKDDPDGLAVDEEGDEFPSLDALMAHVLETSRDLFHTVRSKAIPDWSTCTFEVTDETGQRVLTLQFSE